MNKKFFNFLSLVKKSGNLLEGYDKCENGIKRHKVSLVILSSECSSNTRKKFINYCNKDNITIISDISKYDLGLCLGKQEFNILGVTQLNMSNKLISLIKPVNNSGVNNNGESKSI